MSSYLDVESISDGSAALVKQDLKFRTGKFIWRIKFTAPLNPATVNSMNLYVTNSSDRPLNTAIRYDSVNNYIEIEPLEPYAQNEPYILNITRNVESRGGQKLKNDLRLRFKL